MKRTFHNTNRMVIQQAIYFFEVYRYISYPLSTLQKMLLTCIPNNITTHQQYKIQHDDGQVILGVLQSM